MINKMPEEIKEKFDVINREVKILYLKWLIFKDVYGNGKEQIQLLNKIDSGFFAIVQGVYWNDIFLSISRLTDNAKTGSNKNLTLKTLLETIEDKQYGELYTNASSKLEELESECEGIRTLRNKRIAHSDYKTLMEIDEISVITLEIVEKSITLIDEFMNLFDLYFNNNQTLYSVMTYNNAGKQLIENLRKI